MSIVLLIGAAVLIVSLAVTAVYRDYALRKLLLDIPNSRSSHRVATPRGGGVAIWIGFWLGIGLAQSLLPLSNYASLFCAALILAGVSFLDDLSHVDARWRLAAQALAVILVLCGQLKLGGMTLPGLESLPWLKAMPLLWLALLFVLLVWLINLYNFMDGIDGIAALAAINTVLALGVLLGWQQASAELYLPGFVLAAASGGFLWWNFPRAKIFMGDIGSCFLGLVLGWLALYLGQWRNSFFWAVLILLAPFLTDASLTLVRRAWRRQTLYQAHREHAYQHLAQAWQSHPKVTLCYSLMQWCYLLPIAALLVSGRLDEITALFCAFIPLGLFMWLAGSGTPARPQETGA